jgi:hypothetical protein
MPVFPALKRLRHKDPESKANLSYIKRLYLKKKRKDKGAGH